MKWYKQNYINRKNWVLDNLEFLGLTNKEALIILMIEFFNENNQDITIEILSKKIGDSVEEVNKVLSVLMAKKYLQIKIINKSTKFVIDNLYEVDVAIKQRSFDSTIFELFQTEFKRPLTNNEMEKISLWLKTRDSKLVVKALKEASIYKKVNIAYIEKVLNGMEN